MARIQAKVPETGATVPNPLLNDRGQTVITCGAEEPQISRAVHSNKGKVPTMTHVHSPARR
jgi:hypothetical protein